MQLAPTFYGYGSKSKKPGKRSIKNIRYVDNGYQHIEYELFYGKISHGLCKYCVSCFLEEDQYAFMQEDGNRHSAMWDDQEDDLNAIGNYLKTV